MTKIVSKNERKILKLYNKDKLGCEISGVKLLEICK